MIISVFLIGTIIRVGLGFWIYSYIANWTSTRLGFDYYLTQLLSVTITGIITIIAPYLAWYLLIGRWKLLSTFIMIICAGSIALLTNTVGKNVYFNRNTGEALRYYANTPKGIVLSFSKGYDPEYGVEYMPYTKEIAEKIGGLNSKFKIIPIKDDNLKCIVKDDYIYENESKSYFNGQIVISLVNIIKDKILKGVIKTNFLDDDDKMISVTAGDQINFVYDNRNFKLNINEIGSSWGGRISISIYGEPED